VNGKTEINKEAIRNRKTFVDKKFSKKDEKKYQVDADLNAARNILTAKSARRFARTSAPL
jgi:transposase